MSGRFKSASTWLSAGLTLMLILSGCQSPARQTPTRSLLSVTPSAIPTNPPVPAPTFSPLSATEIPALTATHSAASQAEMACPPNENVCIVAGHFAFQRPLDPSANNAIDQTYRYGTTQDDKREPHHGDDFPNKQGTHVLAAADGMVIVAGNDKLKLYGWVTGFYGNLVVIEHRLPGFEQPVYTLYGHLYKVHATEGQQVKAGDLIGEVGATGIAIGSHLHFEVRIGANTYKSTRNPDLWLVPPPGAGTLAGRIFDANGSPVKSAVTIQRLENGAILPAPVYPIETYAHETLNGDDTFHESFAVGELPAGEYRLSLIYNGKIYEEVVKIEQGKLSLVTFVLS